jgi:hypothetical protein
MNLVHIEALGAFIRGLRSDTYWRAWHACMTRSSIHPPARLSYVRIQARAGTPESMYAAYGACVYILLIVVEHGACFAEQARKTSTNSKLQIRRTSY